MALVCVRLRYQFEGGGGLVTSYLAQVRHFIVLWKYGISPFPFSVDFFFGDMDY